MSGAVLWGALAFILAEVAVLVALLVVAARSRGRAWRRGEAERRLRPLALAFVEGPAVDIGDLTLHERRALTALVAGYGERLSGLARERVAALLEQSGRLEHEIAAVRGAARAEDRLAAAIALGDIGACTRRAGDRRPASGPERGERDSLRSVDALVDALRDADPAVRAAAAHSLGRTGVERSVEPIVRAFADGLLSRVVAGEALSGVGAVALPPLVHLAAAAPDRRVREACARLVGAIGGGTRTERSAATAGGSPALLLVPLLGDPDEDVRAAAAWALGRIGTASSQAVLADRLSDPSGLVRASAAEALGRLAGSGAVSSLLVLAEDEDVDVAVAAALAAARLDSRTVLEAAGAPGASAPLREAADLVALGQLA